MTVRRPRLPRPLLTAGCLMALALAPSASAAPGEQVLTQLPNESTLRADGDRLLVNVYDPAAGYHLTLLEGGRAERLPLAPSPTPLEADLGRDTSNRPAVVLARCAGGDCDVHVHRLGTATEDPVAGATTSADERHPTLSRGRVAWARGASVRVGSLEDAATTTLPGPSTHNCAAAGAPDGQRKDCRARGRAITDLELDGDRLAVTGDYVVPGQAGFVTRELRFVDVRRRSSRVVASLSAGEGGQTLVGASFSRGRLGWAQACFGDPGGCGQAGAHRWYPGSNRYEREERYRHHSGFVMRAGGFFGVDGGTELGDDDPAFRDTWCEGPRVGGGLPTCPVVRVAAPDWQPVARRRVRRAG